MGNTENGDTREINRCELCGASIGVPSQKRQTFAYGTGDDQVELAVMVPVFSCDECGFEYTDDVAERIRHEAVCDHLGVLPPARIRRLREQVWKATREEFSDATGIGTASLARWETGAVVQTQAYDRYLRLLHYPVVRETLGRVLRGETSHTSPSGQENTNRQFPRLNLTVVRQEAERFQLQRAG